MVPRRLGAASLEETGPLKLSPLERPTGASEAQEQALIFKGMSFSLWRSSRQEGEPL